MPNNLEPRAKIGDVVIFKMGDKLHQFLVTEAMRYDPGVFNEGWIYGASDRSQILDKSILKNLTTNVSYE